jgi:hypothetical protein
MTMARITRDQARLAQRFEGSLKRIARDVETMEQRDEF